MDGRGESGRHGGRRDRESRPDGCQDGYRCGVRGRPGVIRPRVVGWPPATGCREPSGLVDDLPNEPTKDVDDFGGVDDDPFGTVVYSSFQPPTRRAGTSSVGSSVDDVEGCDVETSDLLLASREHDSAVGMYEEPLPAGQ